MTDYKIDIMEKIPEESSQATTLESSKSLSDMSKSSSSVPSLKASQESVVKSSDMSNEMQEEALQVATTAMKMFRIEKDIATFIKEEFDKRYFPSWHCVVGRNFGSYVTHETNHFIYFYIQHIAIMLFKTGF